MAMSAWMESVTGRSNSEHQAWRDNYNGGWAAGDWTGNTNAAIAWERAATGEDNREIRSHLPEGLTPQMISGKTTSNHNRGGSVGQGASPSQSGGSVGQGASPSQSGGALPTLLRRPNSGGVGPISSGRLNFGATNVDNWFGKLATDFDKLVKGGTNQMEWAEKPLQHEQVLWNGLKVVHDRGYSSGEVNEATYGEGDQPWTPTFWLNWSKAIADADATFAANGYPSIGEQINNAAPTNAINEFGLSINKAVRDAIAPVYAEAEKGWNAATDWVAQQRPADYTSTPGPRNPYAGSSPFSAPFN